MKRVASFLGPPRPVARPPDAWFEAVQAANGDSFAFTLWRQEEDNWCWAAIAQAVENAMRGRHSDQQDVATAHISRHRPGTTCAPPNRFIDNGGRCDENGCNATCGSTHAASVVLAESGLLAATLTAGQPVRMTDVQAQTAARRPIVCRIEGGGVGHFICLAGWWIGPDGVNWLLVHDPRYGNVGQQVSAGYVKYDVVAYRYQMGAAYGRNDHSYAVR